MKESLRGKIHIRNVSFAISAVCLLILSAGIVTFADDSQSAPASSSGAGISVEWTESGWGKVQSKSEQFGAAETIENDTLVLRGVGMNYQGDVGLEIDASAANAPTLTIEITGNYRIALNSSGSSAYCIKSATDLIIRGSDTTKKLSLECNGSNCNRCGISIAEGKTLTLKDVNVWNSIGEGSYGYSAIGIDSKSKVIFDHAIYKCYIDSSDNSTGVCAQDIEIIRKSQVGIVTQPHKGETEAKSTYGIINKGDSLIVRDSTLNVNCSKGYASSIGIELKNTMYVYNSDIDCMGNTCSVCRLDDKGARQSVAAHLNDVKAYVADNCSGEIQYEPLEGETIPCEKKGFLTYAQYHYAFFSLDGGTGTTPDTIRAGNDTKITLPQCAATKEGYTFAGWSDGKTTYKPGSEYQMKSSDVTFNAVWDRNEGDNTLVIIVVAIIVLAMLAVVIYFIYAGRKEEV